MVKSAGVMKSGQGNLREVIITYLFGNDIRPLLYVLGPSVRYVLAT